eukprot:4379345-Amphidinium_carterae.1
MGKRCLAYRVFSGWGELTEQPQANATASYQKELAKKENPEGSPQRMYEKAMLKPSRCISWGL